MKKETSEKKFKHRLQFDEKWNFTEKLLKVEEKEMKNNFLHFSI